MKDEIKEILEYLKDDSNWYRINNEEECIVEPYKLLLPDERNDLLDYITNLQQENERLKEEHNQLRNCRKYDLNLISNLKHDKARYEEIIDKAIEYIDKQKKKMYKSRNKIALFILMKLENILQNGSENNE